MRCAYFRFRLANIWIMDTTRCHEELRLYIDPPAFAILFAAVGNHMARRRRMVVNAIGAGWIIVIGRSLCADGMQFFLCNHAHVGPICVLLARTVVVVAGGFSVGSEQVEKEQTRICRCSCCCYCRCSWTKTAATYLHRQKAMSRFKSSCGPL